MAAATSTLEQIDPKLKQNAEKILQVLGMTPVQAMSLFYKQIELHQGLPFPLTLANLPARSSVDTATEYNELQELSDLPSNIMEQIEIYVPPETKLMVKEAAAFEQMQSELQEQYPNEYIAVYDGQVVDHDRDEVALIKRRKQNFAGKVVLIRHVDEEPNKTITIRSPRMVLPR
ncbi:MAG: DUF5678 domain-containing protein [Chloroflexota bacterium]